MIDMLSKPVGEITIGDIQTLIESTIPESEQIEFKEAPPATNGIDPWMSGGNIGDHAKNKILEEVVAFANAYGGVLLLGVKESSTNPSTAEEINPVPEMCRFSGSPEAGVSRLCGASSSKGRDCRQSMDDSGVVVIRVGKSRAAPHRVTKTLVCPIRRQDRCEKMTMREIQDMTINVARGLERLDKRLLERSKRFEQEFKRLERPDDALGFSCHRRTCRRRSPNRACFSRP